MFIPIGPSAIWPANMAIIIFTDPRCIFRSILASSKAEVLSIRALSSASLVRRNINCLNKDGRRTIFRYTTLAVRGD
jgi:hypothetical protein